MRIIRKLKKLQQLHLKERIKHCLTKVDQIVIQIVIQDTIGCTKRLIDHASLWNQIEYVIY